MQKLRERYIDGIPYCVCLPAHEGGKPVPALWRGELAKKHSKAFRHFKPLRMFSRSLNPYSQSRDYFTLFFTSGGTSIGLGDRSAYVGWRPCLLPLDESRERVDASVLEGIADGETIDLGKLLIDGAVQRIPSKGFSLIASDNHPPYRIDIADSAANTVRRLKWVKMGDALFSRDLLIRNIPLQTLLDNQLVFAPGD